MRKPLSDKEFKYLYTEYFGSLCLYANRYIKDLDVSKDLVSDVFVAIWQDRGRLSIKSDTALAYLKTSIKNRALNYLKHQSYEWSHVEYIFNQPHTYASSPDSVYSVEELYQLLEEGLKELEPEYREVFIQSVLKKKSHEDIANELDISLRTVNRHKQKALGHLRRVFKDYLAMTLFLTSIIK